MEKDLYERFFVAEETHWWFRARRRILASVMESLPLPENAEIADFGCGTGGMMSSLSPSISSASSAPTTIVP